MKKILLTAFLFVFPFAVFSAPDLTAGISVDMRASTAAAAKKDAVDSAVRNAVIQIVSRYSDKAIVENLLMASDDLVLQDLVSSTSIASEKTSKTAYSAIFNVTLDRVALEKWYSDNNVPNFLSAADESQDKSIISIDLANGLSDWAGLNQLVRDDGDTYGLELRSIFRGSATAYVLTSKRTKFQNLCTSAGWTVSNKDGIIRISK
jgi:hypothetical protein